MAKVNDDKILIKIYDTAGQEKFESLGKNFLKGAEGVLLFYDITKEESFDKVSYWINIYDYLLSNIIYF